MKYTSNTIRINIYFIISIVLLFCLIAYKMCYIGLNEQVEGTNLKELAESRTTATKTIKASRGNIYDNQGNVLAQNVNSYTLIAYLDESRTTDPRYPKHVQDKEYTAEMLASVLEPVNEKMTKDYILERLSQTGKYQVEFGKGGKNLSEMIKRQIDELALPGIDFERTSKRYYPYGDFASYIIGYAKKYEDNEEAVGELGVEEYTNRYLKGTDGEIVYQKDRYGYQLANKMSYTTKEVKNGYDVYLTLDTQIQIFLDNAVKEISEYEASWVTFTVADAKTGAIIGSSTNPSFNPNTLNITNYNNPLTSFAYEPGSTMKIFSFMTAMELGKYDGAKKYKSGSKTIDEYTIRDWNKVGWGSITYDTGFTYSSNIAASNLASEVGRKNLASYYDKLGFGHLTGIELANEYSGDMSFEYATELATASYGQGVTVTPVQMIQALTVLTNDGTTLKPYIIDKIVDPNTGNVVYQSKVKELNKVYSTSTVNKIKDLMDKVVNGSDPVVTGKGYKTDAVRLIGKTGTSYYVDESGKYATGNYKNIRSFAGVFPKEDPQYIIYVAVKDFHGSGSQLGGIVKKSVESISKYRNLDQRESDRDESKIVTIPKMINTSVISSKTKCDNLGVTCIVIGDGNTVINQYPKVNSVVSQSSKVFLVTNGKTINMPDISKWSSKEVNDFCNLSMTKCKFNGYGYVVSTNIKPNDIINETTVIEVNLQSVDPAILADAEEETNDTNKDKKDNKKDN